MRIVQESLYNIDKTSSQFDYSSKQSNIKSENITIWYLLRMRPVPVKIAIFVLNMLKCTIHDFIWGRPLNRLNIWNTVYLQCVVSWTPV